MGQVGHVGRVGRAGLIALACAMAACGGGDSTPSTSAPTPVNGGVPGNYTIVIANNTASPQNLTVPAGSRITFVNNDTRGHLMFSDPHPEHTDCPELNSVGDLEPGQSRQSDNLVITRTCGFHDHINFLVKTLQGTITIQ